MTVNLKGLKDNARKTSIATLNACLADAIALGLAVKQAHWNVKGRNFIAVHELFDSVHANLQAHIDIMAEQVQILDGVALGTLEVVGKASRIEPYPTDLTKAEDHIKAVCDRLRDLGGALREAIDTVDEAGDADTADIFTAASRQADKDLWFLSSHLD
ncbi:DNA starvation/stationary phase protection protein Dps [Paracoccus sp. p4-l81]|uniref:DNA starvation/stationary phase protection protein Dps n=1 Tax=unclassified Paracoccus (in: a-proteobacteria) TaxID=2688777 RepID=UPI0035B81E6A